MTQLCSCNLLLLLRGLRKITVRLSRHSPCITVSTIRTACCRGAMRPTGEVFGTPTTCSIWMLFEAPTIRIRGRETRRRHVLKPETEILRLIHCGGVIISCNIVTLPRHGPCATLDTRTLHHHRRTLGEATDTALCRRSPTLQNLYNPDRSLLQLYTRNLIGKHGQLKRGHPHFSSPNQPCLPSSRSGSWLDPRPRSHRH